MPSIQKLIQERISELQANFARFEQIKRFTLFVSRDAMNIDGLGPAIVRLLIENGHIRDAADLYSLGKEDIAALPRMGEKSAENLIKSGDEKFKLKAIKTAKDEFKSVFPDGADSKDNYLYIIVNESNEKIGVIGYEKSPFEENAAFVTENVTKEDFRGKGYGKSAFLKLQDDAKRKGFSKMVLNVFKHNTVAYSMYQNCGFKVIEDYGDSVIMEKVFNGE